MSLLVDYQPFFLLSPHCCVCACVCMSCSVVSNPATPWTVAHQVPLSKGFSRQEYWSGSPFPPPGDLPDPGVELQSRALAAAWAGIWECHYGF